MARSAASGWACGVWRAAIRSILEVGTPSHDMEKRIFAAVLISIGLLWLWAALAPKLFPELAKKPAPPKPAVTSTTGTPAGSSVGTAVGMPGAGRAAEGGSGHTEAGSGHTEGGSGHTEGGSGQTEGGSAHTEVAIAPVAAAAATVSTIDTPNF